MRAAQVAAAGQARVAQLAELVSSDTDEEIDTDEATDVGARAGSEEKMGDEGTCTKPRSYADVDCTYTVEVGTTRATPSEDDKVGAVPTSFQKGSAQAGVYQPPPIVSSSRLSASARAREKMETAARMRPPWPWPSPLPGGRMVGATTRTPAPATTRVGSTTLRGSARSGSSPRSGSTSGAHCSHRMSDAGSAARALLARSLTRAWTRPSVYDEEGGVRHGRYPWRALGWRVLRRLHSPSPPATP